MLQHIIGNPLLFFLPFLCSPFVPFYLLGTLLAVIGSVHLVSRLLVNWSFHFPPLAHIPLTPKSRPPWGFPDLNIHSLGLYRETGSQDPAHLYCITLYYMIHPCPSCIFTSSVLPGRLAAFGSLRPMHVFTFKIKQAKEFNFYHYLHFLQVLTISVKKRFTALIG